MEEAEDHWTLLTCTPNARTSYTCPFCTSYYTTLDTDRTSATNLRPRAHNGFFCQKHLLCIQGRNANGFLPQNFILRRRFCRRLALFNGTSSLPLYRHEAEIKFHMVFLQIRIEKNLCCKTMARIRILNFTQISARIPCGFCLEFRFH